MATREEIYEAIRNADKAGDSEAVQKLGAYLQTMPSEAIATTAPAAKGFDAGTAARSVARMTPSGILASALTSEGRQELGNSIAGGLRGAASIGATLLYPVDKALDLIKGDRDPNVTGLVTGKQPMSRNQERRQAVDEGLRMAGADTNSGEYKLGKLSTEVAGTMGAGGLAANALARTGLATMAPGFVNAVRTGGAAAGDTAGIANLLTRSAGGAVNGALSAGLVDPSQAKQGALIGGAMPIAAKALGSAGNALGKLVRGPEQAPELADAVKAARDAGYVIPPSQANPNMLNRGLEGMSGKITTAQNASAKNQLVTNAKAATALGLPEETKITPEVLDAVRAEAGKAYKAVSELGAFDATGANLPASVNVTRAPANTLMGRPETASVDAGEVVRAWRQANSDATAYFRQYARDANPETLTKAKNAASEAKSLDDFMLKSVQTAQKDAPQKLIADLSSGAIDQPTFMQKVLKLTQQGDLGAELKAARTLIAKTHSVEGAMNAATGAIDARKLAAQLQKGRPLSGELKDAAEFAGRFPKAAQTVEQMGSLPQTSPLDWSLAAALTAATSNPLALASAMARPAARGLSLSPLIQDGLIQQPAAQNALARLAGPDAAQLAYRAAPSALSAR